MQDELIEYFLVNKELGMSPGKVAAQVAHVQTLIDKQYSRTPTHIDWLASNQKKIILVGREKDLLKWIEAGATYIRDNGLTEIPAGSLTCCAFRPQPRSNVLALTKRMQLMK